MVKQGQIYDMLLFKNEHGINTIQRGLFLLDSLLTVLLISLRLLITLIIRSQGNNGMLSYILYMHNLRMNMAFTLSRELRSCWTLLLTLFQIS